MLCSRNALRTSCTVWNIGSTRYYIVRPSVRPSFELSDRFHLPVVVQARHVSAALTIDVHSSNRTQLWRSRDRRPSHEVLFEFQDPTRDANQKYTPGLDSFRSFTRQISFIEKSQGRPRFVPAHRYCALVHHCTLLYYTSTFVTWLRR